jgi:hypothetical protein
MRGENLFWMATVGASAALLITRLLGIWHVSSRLDVLIIVAPIAVPLIGGLALIGIMTLILSLAVVLCTQADDDDIDRRR